MRQRYHRTKWIDWGNALFWGTVAALGACTWYVLYRLGKLIWEIS